LPCPHCGYKQKLEFPQVKWSQEARDKDGNWNAKLITETAHYECVNCQGKITDAHKPLMMRQGEWVAENSKADPANVGYHLNSLYSPTITFADVAKQFLKEKRFLNGLKNFINSWLALPFDDQFTDEKALEYSGGFVKREVWADEAIRLMAVDVQTDCFWYVVRAYDKLGNSRLIDEGKIANWDEVEARRKELNVEAEFVFIDSAYNTQEVYARCWLNGYAPLRGEDKADMFYHEGHGRRIYNKPQTMECYLVGGNARVNILQWSSQHSQDLLAWLMRGEQVKWEVAGDVSDDYKKQMTSHVKKHRVNAKTGLAKYQWCKRSQKVDDHLWDCETMLVVAAVYGKLIEADDIAEEYQEPIPQE
jgi:hypothetical protein